MTTLTAAWRRVSDFARDPRNFRIALLVAAAFVAGCGGEEATVQEADRAPAEPLAARVGSSPEETPPGEDSSSGSGAEERERVEHEPPAAGDPPSSSSQAMQLGLSAAADYSAVYPTSVIPAPTRRITIVFRFDEESRYERLGGALVAVDVGDAAPPGTEVASTAMAVRGKDRGALNYTLPRPFPPGTYRVDVTADDEPWSSLEFRVATVPAGDVPSPTDLMPLDPGTTWTYDFTQRAGRGARLNVPEEQVGPDGVFRATATLSITGAEDAGQRVELRRDGELQTEEWWRADETGIVSTQSREDGELTILDPPRPVFPMPADLPREWKYEMRDGSFELEYRVWGPLPVHGPSGEASGYVVFVKHDGPAVTTVERHFIPRLGMMKEVIVLGLRGQMMSRQEMVLRSVASGSGE